MPILLPAPEVQFVDHNGDPYAGGTLEFFIPGTDTQKDTWSDNLGTVLNTNPVILDAAGRAIIFGDGDYRAVLKDSLGNLIYDQFTSSVISDVMLPFVRATSLSIASDMLGVTDAIQVETNRATAAEGSNTTAISDETTRAETAETNLSNAITEVKNQIGPGAFWLLEGGEVTTDSSGHAHISFTQPFTGGPYVFCQLMSSGIYDAIVSANAATTGGVDIYASTPAGVGVATGVAWLAYGH